MSAPKNNKNALGNKGGRPTKLTPDLLEAARDYLNRCRDSKEENERQVNLPSLAGLARTIGISRETIYEWQKAEIEFSDICSDILAEQEKRLINNGLSSAYNPTITKLLLAKHGYSDKTETDLTSKGEKIEAINYIVPNGDNA